MKELPILKRTFSIPEFFKINYSGILNSFRQLSPLEPQHSRIICDLINPANKDNKHADLFLELFFKIVLNDEYNPSDFWEVTAEKERYDIRIKNKDNSKIIIIENKSNGAGDRPNQLYRYWYFGIHKAQENINNPYKKILYLSPSIYKRYDEQSITRPDDPNTLDLDEYDSSLPLTLADLGENIVKTVYFQSTIIQWLDECMNALLEKGCMNPLPEKANTYYYLLQYKDFWGNTMLNEIMQKVDEHFKDRNQWNSFSELAGQKNNIIASWYLSLKEGLNRCFLSDNVDNAWCFVEGPNNYEYFWYLKEFGKNALHIWLFQQSLYLIIPPDTLDLVRGKELLKTDKYSKIIGAFECLEESHLHEPQNRIVFVERGKFDFIDEPDNGHIPSDKFAWYSRFETANVVEQILRKINRFREPQITALLKELTTEIKK
jgi:hypothetical protein